MAKKRRCKMCGRLFDPGEDSEAYCSSLCRDVGCFVGGGGDTSKPMSKEQMKARERKSKSTERGQRVKRVRMPREKYPRVHEMLSLPPSERWAMAKTFTPEEQEYSRRVMKHMLQEEQRIDDLSSWDVGEEIGLLDTLGESDDGTV